MKYQNDTLTPSLTFIGISSLEQIHSHIVVDTGELAVFLSLLTNSKTNFEIKTM